MTHDKGKVRVVRYSDLENLRKDIHKRAPRSKQILEYFPEDWAGGSIDDCVQYLAMGDVSKVARAQDMVDKVSNSAVKTFGLGYDYGAEEGELDVNAWLAGEEQCVYGPLPTHTERAPIKIYLDLWISGTIPNRVIENRGIAVLALVQALSLYRSVSLEVVVPVRHRAVRKDLIMTVPVPTAPMDLGRAAFACYNPLLVRQGLYLMTFPHLETTKPDGLGAVFDNFSWQGGKLGEFMADLDGIQEHIFLPMMFDNGIWNDQNNILPWVLEHMNKYGN